MPAISPAFTRQKIAADFATLRQASPSGIYVAPVPDALAWAGVLFVRKGPYADAILRFHIAFPEDYPSRPPVISFQTDLFHPLVTPLTTYTYSTRDTGSDTVSAVDEERLPPGGLSLRHGFPEWFRSAVGGTASQRSREGEGGRDNTPAAGNSQDSARTPPHIVEVLQYIRVVFESESVLDSIPITDVANAGAWHAWRSFRSKTLSAGKAATSSTAITANEGADAGKERTTPASPRQQPGGARRPGEWNWQGVWEDRVRKSIQGSISNPVLFGHDNDVINFRKMEQEALDAVSPLRTQETTS